MTWTASSWRDHPILQVPEYPDAAVLKDVENTLAAAKPVDPKPYEEGVGGWMDE